MRVEIDKDERWPTYTFTAEDEEGFRAKPYGAGDMSCWADVEPETLARWRAVEAAYNAMQDEPAALRGDDTD